MWRGILKYISMPVAKKTLLVVLVVSAVGGALGVWLLYPKLQALFSTKPQKVFVEARNFSPEGVLYFSAQPENNDSQNIYSLNLATGGLSKYLGEKETLTLTPNFLGSSTDTILVSTNNLTDVKNGVPPVLASTNNTKDGKEVVFPILQVFSYSKEGGLVQVTRSGVRLKRNPSWSEPLKLLVYAGKEPKSNLSLNNPDSYSIYIQNASGVEKRIATGTSPTLVPGGESVVVLQDDGLHLVSLKDFSDEKIWPIPAGFAEGSYVAVSKKGDIAWSSPAHHSIYIMKVDTWKPFSGSITHKIPARAVWPTFSPNGEYLAYGKVTDEKEQKQLSVAIFDLVTPQEKVVTTLPGFDWRWFLGMIWK